MSTNYWCLLYCTKYYTEAEIIKGQLVENNIAVQLLNKQDTMYNIALGEIEIYVPAHFKNLAEGILQQCLNN
jgi:hypothetical protein